MKPVSIRHRWRVLHYSWIAFCTTFIAWFAFAPLLSLIQKDFGLSDSHVGWLASAGVMLTIPGRILIGQLVDRFGPRRIYCTLLAVMSVPVFMLAFATGFWSLLALRLIIGLVGCGFVIGIRLIGDWFPPSQLGLAEGIYGGWGNAGSAVAALTMPLLAIWLGWRGALMCAAVPMLVWSVVLWRGVSDLPAGRVFRRTPRESNFNVWRSRQARILCLAYFAAFGSELCVVSFLPKLFAERFDVSLVGAGAFAAIFGGLNLVARPGGGWFADRYGRRNSLRILLAGMATGYVLLGLAPTLPLAVCAVAFAGFFVQAAEGAVFAMVPLVSPTHTGRVAGIVGASGNVGGVLFPLAIGYGLQFGGGSYLPGFLVIALAGLVACVAASKLEEPDAGAGHGFEFGPHVEAALPRVRMTSAR